MLLITVSSSEISTLTPPYSPGGWSGGRGDRSGRSPCLEDRQLPVSPRGWTAGPGEGPSRSPRLEDRQLPVSPRDKLSRYRGLVGPLEQEEDVVRTLLSLQNQTDSLTRHYRFAHIVKFKKNYISIENIQIL